MDSIDVTEQLADKRNVDLKGRTKRIDKFGFKNHRIEKKILSRFPHRRLALRPYTILINELPERERERERESLSHLFLILIFFAFIYRYYEK